MRKIKFLFKSPLSFLVPFFLLLRLINLTLLPIFNDEAIYLDWGWRELHSPGLLFYSLYDAKQPFLMWVFGIAEIVIGDPLFAGRIVSVFCGLITAFGLYKLGTLIFNKKIGYLVFFLYSIAPIFSFYDRQALMEASIGAVGVWSLYFLYKSLELKRTRHFLLLGVILGVGFFIKSSSIIFLFTSIFLILIFPYFRKEYLQKIFYTIMGFLAVDSLLFMQPIYWRTLPTNSRFSFTPLELLHFPINTWFDNLWKNLDIILIFLTPVMLLGVACGIILLYRKNEEKYKVLLLFILTSLVLETIFTKGTSQRYLLPFLPLVLLFCAYVIYTFSLKLNKWIVYFVFFSLPLVLTLIQITNPVQYFNITSSLSPFSEKGGYITSQTSGYAALDTVKFIKEQTESGRIGVGVGLNTGNPESALIVYFNKNPLVNVFYMDSRIKGVNFSEYECFTSNIPTFFAAREKELVGLDRFFSKYKEFENKYGDNTVGLYKLKSCNGKKLNIDL